jgi:AraC-like DNA-binding protein
MPFPTNAFGDVGAALRWLGHEDEAPLMKDLSGVLDQSSARAPIMRDLEIFLAMHPNATPGRAAHALGLSIRSLQRRLSDQGTTFRGVLDATRVRLAQSLLVESDATITEIALRVGLTSPQHLSTLFRKNGLEPPRAWRARART